MIFQLDDTIIFPDPSLAEEDGLLAVGGDLSNARLLLAYQNGIFPWYSEREPICWYAPHERCVIFPEKIHVSRHMQKLVSKKTFTMTEDTAFTNVIAACKTISRNGQPGTWITDEMEAAYNRLHRIGVARSVEVWFNDELVGGIYGVLINDVFCGESMFSKISNASKAALIWLCKNKMYKLIDCQLPNDHLLSMGAEMIPQQEFLDILKSK